jgi:hypothetical protein
VTWRRVQRALLSAHGLDATAIAKVAFTSQDRVRDVIHNFNADGFTSMYSGYKGGCPPKFTLTQRREIEIEIDQGAGAAPRTALAKPRYCRIEPYLDQAAPLRDRSC